jgi:hypothetical protein
MSTESLPDGPDRDELIGLIRERWPHAPVARIEGAIFFSLDDKHWPNFATIVWTDDFDEDAPSKLFRPGVYRVNIGLDKAAFQRLVDQVLPHPVYAKQRWVSILNPSHATVGDIVLPLIAESHDRLVAQRERQRR